jgi:signal transduction histidine kinase
MRFPAIRFPTIAGMDDAGTSPAWSSGRAWASSRAVVWGGSGVIIALAAVGFGLGLERAQPAPPPVPVALAGAVLASAASFPLARRRAPLLLYAVAGSAGIALVGGLRSANVGWLAVPLIGGWCSLAGGRRAGLPFLAGEIVLFATMWTVRPDDPGWSAWLAASVLTFSLGMLLRHQFDLVERLHAAQSELASKARAEERNRIARDLHDVIAHTLTVSLLHVMSARLAVEHDPADASRSLAEAERLCRESLGEVRTAVGMLRTDGDVRGLAPLPGADGLPDLVGRFQAAGVRVTLTTDGDLGGLPATVGLALYRILQEALTNVVKHAPGSAATVRLVIQPESARLSVHSTGTAAAGPGHGPGHAPGPGHGHGHGHGLVSMRERAESVGGSCAAGPDHRGWLVSAQFPLSGSRELPAPDPAPHPDPDPDAHPHPHPHPGEAP